MIEWKTLLLALSMIESGDNPNAVGKAGEVSQYQITSACLADANDYIKTSYTMADIKADPRKAGAVCRAYLMKYGLKYQADTGKVPSPVIYALLWNQGPHQRWFQKESINTNYCNRVGNIYYYYLNGVNTR